MLSFWEFGNCIVFLSCSFCLSFLVLPWFPIPGNLQGTRDSVEVILPITSPDLPFPIALSEHLIIAWNAVSLVTRLNFLYAWTQTHTLHVASGWACTGAVPEEGRTQTHEGGRSPKPFLLLSIFSRFLPVIGIGQPPAQTTWHSVIERNILIDTRWWCAVFEEQKRWPCEGKGKAFHRGWGTPQFPSGGAELMDPPAAHVLSGSLSLW